ncbi:MAG: hypothetical protein JNM72_18625 [Deltaproteobacteria bacterium]|nr:hypothetical protein [Deltaproteobacteria bacterium]
MSMKSLMYVAPLRAAGPLRRGRALPSMVALGLTLFGCGSKLPTGSEDSGGEEDGGDGGGAGGLAWEDLRLQSSASLTEAFASGGGLYATAEDGRVYLRAEGAWTPIELDTNDALNGIWGRVDGASARVVAVGDSGAIAGFDGTAWTAANTLGSVNLESIAGLSEDNLIAVGWGGAFELVEGAWVVQTVPETPQLNHVWTDGTVVVAVGQEGSIATRRAGTWTTITHESRKALYGVSGTSPNDLWAVGEDGLLLHFDGGAWTEVPTGTTSSLWGVLARSPSEVIVVGSSGVAFRTDGVDIVDLPTGVNNNLYGLSVSIANVVGGVGSLGMPLRLY